MASGPVPQDRLPQGEGETGNRLRELAWAMRQSSLQGGIHSVCLLRRLHARD